MSVSPFYATLEGAQEYVFRFPVRSGEGVGPHWLDDGVPLAGETEEEPILAVPFGGGRYRLAELCAGPFSCCLLRWGGDEFEADAESDTLILRRVVMPAAYQHYFWMTSGGGLENAALGDLLHRYGGGWEVVAGGGLPRLFRLLA